jgi:hypothetical protein
MAKYSFCAMGLDSVLYEGMAFDLGAIETLKLVGTFCRTLCIAVIKVHHFWQ